MAALQVQQRRSRSRTVDAWLALADDFDAKRRVAGVYGVDFRVPEPSDAHRRTLRLLVEAASLKPRLVRKGGDVLDRLEQHPVLANYSTLESATPTADSQHQQRASNLIHPYPDVLCTPTGDAFNSSFPYGMNIATYTSDSEFETGTERSATPRADTDTEIELEEWIHSQNLAPSSPSSTQSSKSPYQFRVPELPSRITQQNQQANQDQQVDYPKTRPRAPSAPTPHFFNSGVIPPSGGGGGVPHSPQSIGSASGSTPSLSSSSSTASSLSSTSSIHKRNRRGTESALRPVYTRRSPLVSSPSSASSISNAPSVPLIPTGSTLGRPRAKSTLVHSTSGTVENVAVAPGDTNRGGFPGAPGGSLKIGAYGYRYPAHPPYPPQPLVPITSGPASAPALGTPHPQQLMQSVTGGPQVQNAWATSWDGCSTRESDVQGLSTMKIQGLGDDMGGWGRVSDPLPGFQQQRPPIHPTDTTPYTYQMQTDQGIPTAFSVGGGGGGSAQVLNNQESLGMQGYNAPVSLSVPQGVQNQGVDQSLPMDYINQQQSESADYSSHSMAMSQSMPASAYYNNTSAEVDISKYGSYSNFSSPFNTMNRMQ